MKSAIKPVMLTSIFALACATSAHAQSTAQPAPKLSSAKLDFEMMSVSTDGKFAKMGDVTAADTEQGLELRIAVKGLSPGDHGLHIHQNGSCAAGMKDGQPSAAESAGAHYDPDLAKTHGGPNSTGHRGDLPKLSVVSAAETKVVLIAPRLKVADVAGRSLMIHEGGDTYSDQPELGGGGKRIACGVIPRL